MAQIIRRPGRVPAELRCLDGGGGGRPGCPSPSAAAKGAAQGFGVGLLHQQRWNWVLGGGRGWAEGVCG